MSDLFRESVFGHFIRLISNNRLLQYAEEKDPKIWKQYIDHGQTKNMALHGNAAGPTQDEKEHELKDFEFSLPPLSDPSSKIKLPNYPSQHSLGPQPSLEFGPSPASSKVQLGDYESRYGSQSRLNLARTEVEDLEHQHQLSSTITGQRIDTEKGRDITMVSWYGDNDPEVISPRDGRSLRIEADVVKESSKLVYCQKDLRSWRDLSTYYLSLYRLRNIQCRHRDNCRRLRRLGNQSYSWSNPLRYWVQPWAHALGANERDSPNRT